MLYLFVVLVIIELVWSLVVFYKCDSILVRFCRSSVRESNFLKMFKMGFFCFC